MKIIYDLGTMVSKKYLQPPMMSGSLYIISTCISTYNSFMQPCGADINIAIHWWRNQNPKRSSNPPSVS